MAVRRLADSPVGLKPRVDRVSYAASRPQYRYVLTRCHHEYWSDTAYVPGADYWCYKGDCAKQIAGYDAEGRPIKGRNWRYRKATLGRVDGTAWEYRPSRLKEATAKRNEVETPLERKGARTYQDMEVAFAMDEAILKGRIRKVLDEMEDPSHAEAGKIARSPEVNWTPETAEPEWRAWARAQTDPTVFPFTHRRYQKPKGTRGMPSPRMVHTVMRGITIKPQYRSEEDEERAA